MNWTLKVSNSLKGKFDAVFNHTTLEHVYDFQQAFRHLCELSKISSLLSFCNATDTSNCRFWRLLAPTTMTIARLFLENGFEPLVIKCNDQPFAPVYCFAIGYAETMLIKENLQRNRFPDGPPQLWVKFE